MRLKTASLMIALGCAAIALSGCARVRTHQGYLVDNMLVDSIQPGIDNRQSDEGTLGRPTFVSQFGTQDWYYVSRDMRQLAFANPKPKEQTVLRVRFDTAGNVVGIDKAGLDKVAEISPRTARPRRWAASAASLRTSSAISARSARRAHAAVAAVIIPGRTAADPVGRKAAS